MADTTRRRLFAALAMLPVMGAVWRAPSVFAASVRYTQRKWNRDGVPHRERGVSAGMPHWRLEDADAFHALAETCRLRMLAELRTLGTPINVWRCGEIVVRTRASTEHRLETD
jgi:hypothetical protein